MRREEKQYSGKHIHRRENAYILWVNAKFLASKCKNYEIYFSPSLSLYRLHILVNFYLSLLFLTKKKNIYYNKIIFWMFIFNYILSYEKPVNNVTDIGLICQSFWLIHSKESVHKSRLFLNWTIQDYVDNAIEMWNLYLFLCLYIQEQLTKPNIKKIRNQFRNKKRSRFTTLGGENVFSSVQKQSKWTKSLPWY